jgi:DNA-binding MarR family transcriptional regulator
MSRKLRKTGRSNKEARHVRLYHLMLKTPAWKSLTANARAIYVEIAARYGGLGSNNGRIPYSVRDAAKSLKIGKSTAAKAIQQLQDRGFIVEITKGAFSRKNRHATEWRLTESSCDITDALPTREYLRWPQIQNTVPKAGPHGTSSGTARYLQSDNERREAA